MRILNLIHQYLPDKIGGTERYTQSIAHALTERGHQVSVFYRRSAPGAGLDRRDDEGVTVWAAWAGEVTPTRRFLAVLGDTLIERAFTRALEEQRPELVHVQHLMGLPVRLLDELYERHIPVVVTLHDYWWVCANAQLVTNYDQRVCSGPSRVWLNCARCALARADAGRLWPAMAGLAPLLAVRERLLRRGLRQAASIIAPTEFVRAWYAGRGLPTERVQVLPHGIEPPTKVGGATTPHCEDGHRSLEPHPSHARFAYFGGLAWQKGVHVLIEAFNRLPDGSQLWIAGDESADPAYTSSLRASAGPGVRFLGALSMAQVWDTLGQVDVVVIPSLWYETFSLIVHEAFAAGRPVAASRLGALAEVVHDGVDGLMVTPGDVAAWHRALQQLSEAPELRAKLCAGIRPPLTLQEHTTRLEAIYTEILR